jgi:hypothetical protein
VSLQQSKGFPLSVSFVVILAAGVIAVIDGGLVYLHFLNQPNGQDYLQSILNGKALVE